MCQLGVILRVEGQIPDACVVSDTNRPPGWWHIHSHYVPVPVVFDTPMSIDFHPHLLFFLENNDITVVCGTEYMDLSIYLCPVYQALYNESLMVLNNEFSKPECFGTADWNVDPPVLKFRFAINESSISSCKNNFEVLFTIDSPPVFWSCCSILYSHLMKETCKLISV